MQTEMEDAKNHRNLELIRTVNCQMVGNFFAMRKDCTKGTTNRVLKCTIGKTVQKGTTYRVLKSTIPYRNMNCNKDLFCKLVTGRHLTNLGEPSLKIPACRAKPFSLESCFWSETHTRVVKPFASFTLLSEGKRISN